MVVDSESIDYDSQRVEEVGKAYIDKIIGTLPSTFTKDITILCDKEIKSFKNLCSSVFSSRQRPDIAIMAFEKYVILLIEIDSCSSSSSFQNTIRRQF